ncbi:rho GTPase-activating protein 100F-like [Diadema setosum]|uniref:rho GTPase-activating protein 100F-like n=1 Tax=Diadema setosum TaxID=31175 RepID=UPI003B3A0EE7
MTDRIQGATGYSFEVESSVRTTRKQTRSHSSSEDGIRKEARELQIDGPAGFRHVGGITNDTVHAIQAAEREHFADLSRAEEFENLDRLIGHLDGRMNGGKPRISVIQERGIQGGAYLLRTVEIMKIPGETLGFYIREGDGYERVDGIFVSRLMLGGLVEDSGMIKVSDEILYVNNVDVSYKTLDEVYMIMQIPTRLLITLKSRQSGRSSYRHSSSRIHSPRYDKSGSFPASPGRHSAALSSIIDPDRQSNRSSSLFDPVKNGQEFSVKLAGRVPAESEVVETRVTKTEYKSTKGAYYPKKEEVSGEKSHQTTKADVETAHMKRVLSRNRSATTGIIDDGPVPDPSLAQSFPESQSEINLKRPGGKPRLSRPGSFDPSIQPEEDSDSMVFVDEDFDDSLSSSFQNIHGIRSSAPVRGSATQRHHQQQRPYSTHIPPDPSLLDDRGVEDDLLLSVKSADAVPKIRPSSSSDNIVAPSSWTEGDTAERKRPTSHDARMTRQRSNPDEQRTSEMEASSGRSRKSGQGGRAAYLDLFSQQKLTALMRNVAPGRKISMANLAGKKSEQSTESLGDENNSNKYVPKPSPDKKSRRISSSKPLDIDITQFTKIRGDVGAKTRNRHLPFSGILALHLLGGRKMAPTLASRNQVRDLYCVIEIDAVHKAQTATVTGRDEFCWDERFEIDLERAQDMGIMVYNYGWNTEGRQKLCHKSHIRLTQILIHAKTRDDAYNLAIRMEPRGILYISMSFTERHATLKRVPSLDRRGLFGVPLDVVVRREGSPRLIPILLQKCIHEIEVRGINVIGIYRVCGSAKKKKKLHDEFETASALVDLSYDNYPDINIITGVLKDYLRELPDPLMPPKMVERLLSMLTGSSPDDPVCNGEDVVSLVEDFGGTNKETVEYILDHLKNVIIHSERNKMTPYNLAVCFGPVLMSSGKEDGRGGRGSRGATDVRPDARGDSREKCVDCAEKHIELLSCLLDVWPVRRGLETDGADNFPANKVSEEKASSDEPVVPDNQEEDSCYHSNDDLNDGPAHAEGENRQKKESDASEVNWDADHLEVSAC